MMPIKWPNKVTVSRTKLQTSNEFLDNFITVLFDISNSFLCTAGLLIVFTIFPTAVMTPYTVNSFKMSL